MSRLQTTFSSNVSCNKPLLSRNDVSVRVWNRLVNHFHRETFTIEEVANLKEYDFLMMDGIGKKSYLQIIDLITAAGYPAYSFKPYIW
ncbi:hypothetical protein [Pedobacter sp.]|uniref:hypothetical protein n=1 Tax=Pedobacter sp. TaxID=1411316 RepID=UPI003C3DFA0E